MRRTIAACRSSRRCSTTRPWRRSENSVAPSGCLQLQREAEDELAAGRRGGEIDLAAVRFDEVSGEDESEPDALRLGRAERREQAGANVVGDARTVVANRDPHERAVEAPTHLDPSARRRRVDRVVEEIAERLGDLVLVDD